METLEAQRDSFGKELTPAVYAVREQKIQELMATGRDRWSSENIADGRQEWSQRTDNSGKDHTKNPGYEANSKAQEGTPSLGALSLSDLETRLLDIEEQLDYWKGVRDTARQNVTECEARIKAAKEVEVATAFAKGSSSRHDREQALRTVERVTASLEFSRKRLKNSEAQIASRAKQKKEFPFAELKRLRKEDDLRQKMKGRF